MASDRKAPELCSFDDCDRPNMARNYCRYHYQKLKRSGELSVPTVCSIPGCGRPHCALGYCDAHYKRRKSGMPMDIDVPFRRSEREVIIRDSEGRKHCKFCDRWLELNYFSKKKSMSDGLAARCVDCLRAYRYRSTFAELSDILDSQDGKCAVCENKLNRWVVDHDHSCCPETSSCGACTRAILCFNCNTALGMVGDDISLLGKLADYIEYWADRRKLRSA